VALQSRADNLTRTNNGQSRRDPRLYYSTKKGRFYLGHAEDTLRLPEVRRLRGKVQLVFTSPPFPLNRKKKYGNLQRRQYVLWLSTFAEELSELLAPKGSVVIELGNAWEPGLPVFSTLPLEALLEFKSAGQFYLCQEFICYNPAKLPTPAQWVTVKRVRAKDAFTRLWWMSRTPSPDARNTRVPKKYSEDMKTLLRTKQYNAGKRPSEHVIGSTSFLHRHRGAIPPNVLRVANTASNDPYLKYCKAHDLEPHPARMPPDIAEFFIRFLTREGDLVLDPFAGSNVTGAVSERLGRRWLSIEPNRTYVRGSAGRFRDDEGRVRVAFSRKRKPGRTKN